ncbi:hypothetical protein SKAU_G00213520 [Synaphobranchus kaupii]|uniref:Uncharacterized protein n=1 Tax=Synaphobranchus kaupii TaxID=118154 RepID=A0A9Q1F9H2_SYNKA|nr:hypothetical protein SKAU_G00213520 [Synaphobranchus kaupii]
MSSFTISPFWKEEEASPDLSLRRVPQEHAAAYSLPMFIRPGEARKAPFPSACGSGPAELQNVMDEPARFGSAITRPRLTARLQSHIRKAPAWVTHDFRTAPVITGAGSSFALAPPVHGHRTRSSSAGTDKNARSRGIGKPVDLLQRLLGAWSGVTV